MQIRPLILRPWMAVRDLVLRKDTKAEWTTEGQANDVAWVQRETICMIRRQSIPLA